ncbi:MAG: FAD-binding oxidoreductase [Nitriliruptoraceae bacterium]
MTPVSATLLDTFRKIVGEHNVITDRQVTSSYTTDWTGRWHGDTPAVLRPTDEMQVARVLALCHDAGCAVVPQGGNTGLVGGSVPHEGEVVLSLTGLTAVQPIDRDAMQVVVGAGVTVGALHEHVARAGLAYGVDMASRDSATVGGSIATDAGGIRVVRYGTTRAQLNGVEVALPQGRKVTRLDAVAKDTVGYALPQLFVGSEGTLGVITRAQLKVVPRYDARVVAVVALESIAAAVAFTRLVRAELDTIDALELMLKAGVDLVVHHTGAARLFAADYPVYVLIELAAKHDPFTDLADVLSGCDLVLDAVIATDRPTRQRLWALREGHTEAIGQTSSRVTKFDVSVPLPRLDEVTAALLRQIVALSPETTVQVFGHLAEGNLHINVCDAPSDDQALTDLVLGMIGDVGGSISAEHGLGRQKTPYLPAVRSADERALYAGLKAVCDPAGIMNPGVIVA